VAGWLLIIASLIFDPLSARLTNPAAALSPFRINRAASAASAADRYRCPTADDAGQIDWSPFEAGSCDPRCARIQGRCLIQRPYSIGARAFWTMILPLVPLFLMIFGHEAWRRLCPLSALMQIPRLLGIQRRETVTDPRTGKSEKRVRLVKATGFLAKYFWFVQFGLLWVGLSFRLLFINSDRLSLAIFFSSVIVAAMAVGYLFGGKTWCQYICPISPVQKFYTAHLNPYLNFHRPCGFATVSLDERGKRRRQYKLEDYAPPYEKLKSLDQAEQYLKPNQCFAQLDQTARRMSDTECARKMTAACPSPVVPSTRILFRAASRCFVSIYQPA